MSLTISHPLSWLRAQVEVQPTHNRQGIMIRMTHHQIDDIHERSEPLTALFATKSVIYGQFGYGWDQLIARAYKMGADDYIVKHLSPTELGTQVQAGRAVWYRRNPMCGAR